MIEVIEKKDCCGCYACVQKCPKQCITMEEDNEGFDYPTIDNDLCIHCGLCEKVCPHLIFSVPVKPRSFHAVIHPSKEIQLKSSSGGVFSLLATHILKQKGIVFGAGFDEDWNVRHESIDRIENLDKLRMSKYVQSKIGTTYKEAERWLKSGRKVMFVGTPCQIHALKLFLKKDYKNLIAVDFVCHGVPSRKVWITYLHSTLSKQIKSLIKVEFRNKIQGWELYSLSLLYNQKSLSKRKKENGITASKIENIRKNSYLKGFVRDLYLRPSCHNCKNKGFTSESDITLGDFWGIKETYPHLYDKDGVSCMSINTVRGEEYWKTIGAKSNQVSYSEALRFNPSFEQTSLTPPFRAFFFLLLGKLPFNILVFFIHVLNKAHKFLNILHKRPI